MVVYKETANTNVVLRDLSITRKNTAACVSLSISNNVKDLTHGQPYRPRQQLYPVVRGGAYLGCSPFRVN
jgi:hypothetical protein